MSRMRDQRRAAKQADKAGKRRPTHNPGQTLEIDESDIVDEIELDLHRRMLELES